MDSFFDRGRSTSRQSGRFVLLPMYVCMVGKRRYEMVSLSRVGVELYLWCCFGVSIPECVFVVCRVAGSVAIVGVRPQMDLWVSTMARLKPTAMTDASVVTLPRQKRKPVAGTNPEP